VITFCCFVVVVCLVAFLIAFEWWLYVFTVIPIRIPLILILIAIPILPFHSILHWLSLDSSILLIYLPSLCLRCDYSATRFSHFTLHCSCVWGWGEEEKKKPLTGHEEAHNKQERT